MAMQILDYVLCLIEYSAFLFSLIPFWLGNLRMTAILVCARLRYFSGKGWVLSVISARNACISLLNNCTLCLALKIKWRILRIILDITNISFTRFSFFNRSI